MTHFLTPELLNKPSSSNADDVGLEDMFLFTPIESKSKSNTASKSKKLEQMAEENRHAEIIHNFKKIKLLKDQLHIPSKRVIF